MLLDNDLKDILAACLKDTRLAAKTFLPEKFWRPFDDQLHGQIFDLLDNSDNPLKVIAAPRGVGKTSIINLLLPLKRIVYRDSSYIVPVSATNSLAVQQAENLKNELITNPLLRALYGPLATNNFSKHQWVVRPLGEDICVMPRGAGQQVRGMLYRGNRPNLILVDDLEDPEQVDSEEQRDKKSTWFFADLLNCVDRGLGSKWEVVVLGTVLHQDSLLIRLLEDKSWDSVKLEICDENLESKAPNFLPTREIIKIYDNLKAQGKLDVFYREYRNDPVPAGADAAFPQSFFKEYDPNVENLDRNPDIYNIVLVDPAKTANMRSAHSAIVGVGVNVRNHTIYVRDVVADKFHADEFYREVCDMIARLQARTLGVEVTSLHEFVTYPLKNELARRGMANVEVLELHARGGGNEKGKVKRIKSLIPFYRNGLIRHNKACTKLLEAQLMSFPHAKRWDVMDAFGYISEVLEELQLYMHDFDEREESPADVEREYRELEEVEYEMDPLDGFRIV